MGRRGEKAEHLADEVGANSTAAANHLYTAAALLKARARELAEHHGAPGGEVD